MSCKEEFFNQFEKHDGVMEIGIFLLQNIFLPFFISLISSFVYDKILKHDKDDNVELTIHTKKKNGKKTKIKYKGPASKLKTALEGSVKIINGEDK